METEKALNQLAQDIKDARHDVRLGFSGTADMILSEALRQIEQIKREQLPLDIQGSYETGEEAGRSQVKARHDDDRRIELALSEARTNIGTFFDDLRAIYEPKEGSGPTHG